MQTKKIRSQTLSWYFASAYPVIALTNTVRTVVVSATASVFEKYSMKSNRSQAFSNPATVESPGRS